jgi:hypothetical protein
MSARSNTLAASERTGRLAVGHRTTSGPARPVTEILAQAGVAMPARSPLLGNAVAEALTPALGRDSARVELQWAEPAAPHPGTAVRAESLITRVQSTDTATVQRRIALLDDAGTLRAEGTEIWRLPNTATVHVDAATDFCTPQWGELLRESLATEPDFASALATWDGTIGLRCVDCGPSARELHLRIYRGQIIDVTRRALGGATFTFVAAAHTWSDLMLAERNDFMRRAISGEFASSGNGYEYLRLTKPLNLIIARGRAIAAQRAAEPTEESQA